ncbi:MAG: replicative DNA helicase [Planctomycetes bacterium]|nr:replicative DNA helicase [Planctomycetota bacterium]
MSEQGGQGARGLPRDVSAERAVLGAMLVDPHCIPDVSQVVRPEDFYVPRHEVVCRAIVDTYDKLADADPISVHETLSRAGLVDDAGGREALLDLAGCVVSASSAGYHAEIVREKSIQRAVLDVCTEVSQLAMENRADARELLDEAERRIFEIARVNVASEIAGIERILQETFERIDFFRARAGEPTGLVTGYEDLDEMTGGLQGGELIIIAARPSMGKTSFALNLAERVARRQKGVLVFSLEMGAQQVISNMLCCCSQVNGQAVRSGRLTDREYKALQDEAARLYESPIFVDDSAGLSPTALRAKARRLKQKGDLSMVIIDYLQLMSTGRREESRQQEISTISRALKGLARELNIPVIALSQLNRDVESREDHRPRMSDLRESGAIEQDADVIMLLHREEYFKPTEDNRGLAQLIIAKQRNGPTGDVTLRFFREYMRFENYTRRAEPIA